MLSPIHILHYVRNLIRFTAPPAGAIRHAHSEQPMRPQATEYADSLQGTQHADSHVPDAVWADLGAQALFSRINTTHTLCGEQVLYARMRTYLADAPAAARAYSAYRSQPGESVPPAPAAQCFAPLARQSTSLVAPLFSGARLVAHAPWRYALLSAAPVLALLASVALPTLAAVSFPVACLALCANVIVRATLWERLEQWFAYFEAMFDLLTTAGLLAQTPDVASPASQAQLRHWLPDCQALKRATRFAVRSPLWHNEIVKAVVDLANWLLLADLLLSLRAYRRFVQARDALRALFLLVGQTDADLAISTHLGQSRWHCQAAFPPDAPLLLEDFHHPLLPGETATSLALHTPGMVLTGANGAGKTTLLRAVGLNVLLARTLGFCHSRRAQLPFAKLGTSIHIADDLAGGVSYFLAELHRAKALDALTRDTAPALLLLDEPMRGTNAIESLAISSALLRDWSQRARVITTTHDPGLAHALHPRYESWHMAHSPDTERGAYRLSPGAAPSTNAIDCLTRVGFAAPIISEARRLAQTLSTTQQHYGQTLAEITPNA